MWRSKEREDLSGLHNLDDLVIEPEEDELGIWEEGLISDTTVIIDNIEEITPVGEEKNQIHDYIPTATYSVQLSTRGYVPPRDYNGSSRVARDLPMEQDHLTIVERATQQSINVESRGRLFNIKKEDGSTYHTSEVLYSFIAYKLDPELQRRMPGIEIVFRPDDKNSAFEIVNHYRRRGLSAFDGDEIY